MDEGANRRQVETCGYTNQVRRRSFSEDGTIEIQNFLEPAEARSFSEDFVCIAPDFQPVGDWYSPRRHDFLSVGGMTVM
jgi:hypothetical protein